MNNEKDIVKVIDKSKFNKKYLVAFKSKVSYINQVIKSDSLVKSYVLSNSGDEDEENGYILISRKKCNNRLENMDKKKLLELFEDIGIYSLLSTICKVLKEFHENSIYHGGIKLSNIMIIENYENIEGFELCDYCCKLLKETNKNINNEEMSFEEMNYISPEELSGKDINIKTDMWCIGVLMYKTLSGKYPFEDIDFEEMKRNIINIEYDNLDIDFGDVINPLIRKLVNNKDRINIKQFEAEIDIIYNKEFLFNSSYDNDNGSLYTEEMKEEEVKFISEFSDNCIEISEDSKTIRNVNDNCGKECHCYLSIELCPNAIHHLLFQLNKGKNGIFFGCSSNNEYVGDNLSDEKESCSVGFHNNFCCAYGYSGEKIIDECFDGITIREGEIYEMIFDMIDRTIYIKHEQEEMMIFKDIKEMLYPFVSIYKKGDSVTVLKYIKVTKQLK